MNDDEDRGTYAPPTEDHLAYESRRSPAHEPAPITLIVSGIFLVILLIAVVLFYNSNISQRKVIPDVGTEIGNYKDAQIDEAKPLTDQDLTDVTGLNDLGPTQLAPKTPLPESRQESTTQASVSSEVAPIIRDVPLAQQVPDASSVQKKSTQPIPQSSSLPSSSTAAKVATPVSTGSIAVQIGAFGSNEAADSQYNKIASSYGLFLDGTRKKIEKVDVNGTAYYRTSFIGFTSKDKAKAFCQALKSSGRDCIVK